MLLIPTYITAALKQRARVHAFDAVPAGTVVWEWTAALDMTLREWSTDEPALDASLRELTIDCGDHYLLLADNARYLAHSDDPNLEAVVKAAGGPWWRMVARRPIRPHEWLTVNTKST